MVLVQETHDFLRAVGTLQWGMMTMVFALSHVAYLLVLPGGNASAVAGGAGLVLYLLALTELNDVAQYVWGKSLGRHKVVPKVSPGKTVEGLVGGIVTTTALAMVLAPVLTPLDRWDAFAAGLIIGMGGFLGDITISSVKRDIGVKDSGTMIAGHGGVLDRVNSLMATAPLFFHFIRFFYY
jgi:phosphatidate cytidylyltransferase